MRIIAGSKKGCAIAAPKGMDTRPTLDRVKESLFGILQFTIPGTRVLDLFAGSGNLGLEALSRGAAFASFCDASRSAVRIVEANIQKLGFQDRAKVYACSFEAAICALARAGETVDLVFLDPPYASGLLEKGLFTLQKSGILACGAILVAEHGPKLPPELPTGFLAYDSRRYGEVALSFIREERP
ncbi:MAG: 16S rRNA (guanine(966)-N(2))-methyltransferase RsmD [Candidatus Pelethousia sp.]|nr:16S rRNA (guanine(966)-N(2))-methyltransferase RsmD [Candidatus Pelethousia sp.]